jgi:hypothetical protein
LKNPFKLILIILNEARSFDIDVFQATAVNHTDNFNTWLYGVKIGLVATTRYFVNSDATEIA